jgi:hypothetical protein
MKTTYIHPQVTALQLSVCQAMLSASISPDHAPSSWGDAATDTEGLEINVKGEGNSSLWD